MCVSERQTDRDRLLQVLTVIHQVNGVKPMCPLNHLLQCWHGNLPILPMNDAGPACSTECLVLSLNVDEGASVCVCLCLSLAV